MMIRRRMVQIKRIYREYFNIFAVFRAFRLVCVLTPFLLVLSTVFVVNKELANGGISGKYFWFYGSMGLFALTTLLFSFFDKEKIRFSFEDVLILFFCLSGLAVSYYRNGEITTKFILLILLVCFYFYVRILLSHNKWNVRLAILFLIVTGFVEAVWGLKQLYGFESSQHGLFKTTGSFFNPGPYAGYLVMIFPLALHCWMKATRRLVPLLTCIAILLVLPATVSRAAWLAVIIGSSVVIIASQGFRFKKLKILFKGLKRWIVGGVVVLVLGITLVGIYHLKKDSADGRVLMWKVAMQAIPKHPFGVGLGHFPGAYGEAQAAYFASGEASEQEEKVAGSPEYGFNEYLQICIEWGIFPFILFLVIVFKTIYIGYKQKKFALLASFMSLLVFAFFSYPFSILPFGIVFAFLLAGIHDAEESKGVVCVNPCFIAMISCLLVSFCLYNRYPTYEAYKKWDISKMLYHTKSYELAQKDYEPLYPFLNDQINFLFEYGRILSYTGDYEKSIEIHRKAFRMSGDPMICNIMGKNYQALKDYRQAEICFIKSTIIVPNRLYPWYLLTKLYDEIGLPDKVRETAKIVLTKEPKVQSHAVREMREEIEKIMN